MKKMLNIINLITVTRAFSLVSLNVRKSHALRSWLLLLAFIPIIRLAVQVHNGKNNGLLFFCFVNNAVWKPVYQSTADIAF